MGSSTTAFFLVVPRRPPSLQSHGRIKFQAHLKALCASSVGVQPLLATGPLYARIIWFHLAPTTQDVDNIAKPVLDALVGVVFTDDHMVAKCCLEKVQYGGATLDIASAAAPAGAFEQLTNALASGAENVLYIEVAPLPGRRVTLGPIL